LFGCHRGLLDLLEALAMQFTSTAPFPDETM